MSQRAPGWLHDVLQQATDSVKLLPEWMQRAIRRESGTPEPPPSGVYYAVFLSDGTLLK